MLEFSLLFLSMRNHKKSYYHKLKKTLEWSCSFDSKICWNTISFISSSNNYGQSTKNPMKLKIKMWVMYIVKKPKK